jgi:hypothetical protein
MASSFETGRAAGDGVVVAVGGAGAAGEAAGVGGAPAVSEPGAAPAELQFEFPMKLTFGLLRTTWQV